MSRNRIASITYPGVYSYDHSGKKLWGALADLGRHPATNQRRQARKEGFAREKDARDWRAAAIIEATKGPVVHDGRMTLGEWWQMYVERHQVWNVKTRKNVRYIGAKLGAMGDIRLADLTAADVDLWIQQQAVTHSPATVKQYYVRIRAVLEKAVELDMIGKNVARRVKAPQGKSPEKRSWSEAERDAFLAACAGDPVAGPFFRFIAHTWVRVGEAGGVCWSDVDLGAGTVHIQRTVAVVEGVLVVSPAKAGSERTLALKASMVDELRAERDRQKIARLYQDDGFVFGGGPVATQSRAANWMRKYSALAGVPMITTHGIRHTGASLARAARWDYKLIQERMGHATMSMTVNTYMHVQADEMRAAVEELAV